MSSICTIGLYGAIPVWLEKDAPTTTSRSDSFISQLATGVPLRPSTPAPSGMRVGHESLGLEGGEHRRVEPLGQANDLALSASRAVPDDENGPLGVDHQLRGGIERLCGRAEMAR